MKTERSAMVHKAATEPPAKHLMPVPPARDEQAEEREGIHATVFASLPLTPQGSKRSRGTSGMTWQSPSNLTNT